MNEENVDLKDFNNIMESMSEMTKEVVALTKTVVDTQARLLEVQACEAKRDKRQYLAIILALILSVTIIISVGTKNYFESAYTDEVTKIMSQKVENAEMTVEQEWRDD